MAYDVRKNTDGLAFALAKAFNLYKREVTETLTSFPHCDITSVPTSDDYRDPTTTPLVVVTTSATTLPTVKAVANDMKRCFNLHCADAVCHKAADDTNPFDTADLVTGDSQGATDTWVNALKVAINAHYTESGVHFTDDSTNTISTADASDLTSSEVLVTAMRTKLNAHVALAPTSPSLNLVDC